MSRQKPTAGAFAGALARNRQQLYNMLVQAVEDSGLTQSQIAEWAGVSAEHMSRLLRRPRNIEWDTFGKIIFAAREATLTLSLAFPKAQANVFQFEGAEAPPVTARRVQVTETTNPKVTLELKEAA